MFAVVEQRSTMAQTKQLSLSMALFTARADGGSATPAPQDFCKACVWQLMDASIDLSEFPDFLHRPLYALKAPAADV